MMSGAVVSSETRATRVRNWVMTYCIASPGFPDNLKSRGKSRLVMRNRANPKIECVPGALLCAVSSVTVCESSEDTPRTFARKTWRVRKAQLLQSVVRLVPAVLHSIIEGCYIIAASVRNELGGDRSPVESFVGTMAMVAAVVAGAGA